MLINDLFICISNKSSQARTIMQQFIIYWMITVIILYCLEVKLRGSNIACYGLLVPSLNGQIDETGSIDTRLGFCSHIGY